MNFNLGISIKFVFQKMTKAIKCSLIDYESEYFPTFSHTGHCTTFPVFQYSYEFILGSIISVESWKRAQEK